MSEYDSILKEKKKYSEEPVTKKKRRFPWLQIDIFLILIILIVSYLIYYRIILAPEKIFLEDVSSIFQKYSQILEPMNLQKLGEDYQLHGTILLNEEQYDYGMIHSQDKFKLELARQDQSLCYYVDKEDRLIQLSSLGDEYIQLEEDSYVNILKNLQSNFLNVVSETQYIKKFYFDGYVPIVEVNLELENTQLQEILGSKFQGEWEALFTFKNQAFTNETLSMKVVLHNLSTDERRLFTLSDGNINYSDDSKINWQFRLSKKNEDFTLKIYQNEILYSVLSGSKAEDSYLYTYQVIDKIYTLSLEIRKEEEGYSYLFSSNTSLDGQIVKEDAKITLNILEDVILEDINVKEQKDYSKFTEEEKKQYQLGLETIIGNLREFVDKYKNSIYQVNE